MRIEHYYLVLQFLLLFVIVVVTSIAFFTITKHILKPVDNKLKDTKEHLYNLKLRIEQEEQWYLQMQENNKRLKDEAIEIEKQKYNIIETNKGLQKLDKYLTARGKMLTIKTINNIIDHDTIETSYPIISYD
jgi:septal ring factor EnvC (AmiA/AmiB activator)